MIIADERFVQLAAEGTTHRTLAEACLKCQVRTFRRTGHILALNDERSWTAIRKAARSAHIPHCIVRCIRCGTEAWFLDWYVACDLKEESRLSVLQAYSNHVPSALTLYLQPCPGDEIAWGLEAIIKGG